MHAPALVSSVLNLDERSDFPAPTPLFDLPGVDRNFHTRCQALMRGQVDSLHPGRPADLGPLALGRPLIDRVTAEIPIAKSRLSGGRRSYEPDCLASGHGSFDN